MERFTTDTPSTNTENALNLFYGIGCEVMVRGGGPAPEYADVPLCDFIRNAAKRHFPDVNLPARNDELYEAVPDMLTDGSETGDGIIALLYTAAWAFACLRERLKKYEDTGLTPDLVAEYKTFEDECVSKGVTFGRIVELMNADADRRVKITPNVPDGAVCGRCRDFDRTPGTAHGLCKSQYKRSKSAKKERRSVFQSTIACKNYRKGDV